MISPPVSFLVISLCGPVQKMKTQQCCNVGRHLLTVILFKEDRRHSGHRKLCWYVDVSGCKDAHMDAAVLNPNDVHWVCCVQNLFYVQMLQNITEKNTLQTQLLPLFHDVKCWGQLYIADICLPRILFRYAATAMVRYVKNAHPLHYKVLFWTNENSDLTKST